MKSILQEKKECYICHSTYNLHCHHLYFGVQHRKISGENGFMVYLCYEHHEGNNGVHGRNGHTLDLYLKRKCQEKFEETHSREEFMKLIGKNYII